MAGEKPIPAPASSTPAPAGAGGSAGEELGPSRFPLRPLEGEGRVERSPVQPRAGFGATARAVFWSFFGVRKRAHYEADAAHLNPLHVAIMAVIGAAIFIAVLLAIIKFVVLQ